MHQTNYKKRCILICQFHTALVYFLGSKNLESILGSATLASWVDVGSVRRLKETQIRMRSKQAGGWAANKFMFVLRAVADRVDQSLYIYANVFSRRGIILHAVPQKLIWSSFCYILMLLLVWWKMVHRSLPLTEQNEISIDLWSSRRPPACLPVGGWKWQVELLACSLLHTRAAFKLTFIEAAWPGGGGRAGWRGRRPLRLHCNRPTHPKVAARASSPNWPTLPATPLLSFIFTSPLNCLAVVRDNYIARPLSSNCK